MPVATELDAAPKHDGQEGAIVPVAMEHEGAPKHDGTLVAVENGPAELAKAPATFEERLKALNMWYSGQFVVDKEVLVFVVVHVCMEKTDVFHTNMLVGLM